MSASIVVNIIISKIYARAEHSTRVYKPLKLLFFNKYVSKLVFVTIPKDSHEANQVDLFFWISVKYCVAGSIVPHENVL